jgi:molybdate transport system permease protein
MFVKNKIDKSSSRSEFNEQTSIKSTNFKIGSDIPFLIILFVIGSSYLLLIAGMIYADLTFTSTSNIITALKSPQIQYSIKLSLFTCTITMILSVLISIPIAYFLTRFDFRGKNIIDAIIDIPIILPPLVIGLSLLILFQTSLGRWIEQFINITYAIPSIILAQLAVACAFSVRTMIVTFNHIPKRMEDVALTLGANRRKTFFYILLPESKSGILTAASLSWARALGEFGPILIFSGATRMKTEVLPSTIFLEMSIGNIEGAVAVSLIMIFASIGVLMLVRYFGKQTYKSIMHR